MAGKGQTISAGSLGINAPYRWARTDPNHPDRMTIDPGILEQFEKGKFGFRTFLAAIVKHEVVHYLDGVDDGYISGEENGDAFEEEAYGKRLSGSPFAAAEYEEKGCGLSNGPVCQGSSSGGRSSGKSTSRFDALRLYMGMASDRIGAVTRAEKAYLSQRFREGWKK